LDGVPPAPLAAAAAAAHVFDAVVHAHGHAAQDAPSLRAVRMVVAVPAAVSAPRTVALPWPASTTGVLPDASLPLPCNVHRVNQHRQGPPRLKMRRHFDGTNGYVNIVNQFAPENVPKRDTARESCSRSAASRSRICRCISETCSR